MPQPILIEADDSDPSDSPPEKALLSFARSVEVARESSGVRRIEDAGRPRLLIGQALRGWTGSRAASAVWPHRREAVEAFAAYISDPHAFAVTPTAGGKTLIFTSMVEAAARSGEAENPTAAAARRQDI